MAIKTIQLSTDLVTVAEFKDHIGAYLDRVQTSGHPIVITKNGKAAGVILSPAEYDEFYSKRLLESISRGSADIEAGNAYSSEDAKRKVEQARNTRKAKK